MDPIKKVVIYESWSLNGRGNGTVTYRKYAPAGGTPQWVNEIGEVIQREKGGTYLSGERNAKSKARITLQRGAVKETITVSYRAGAKSGTTHERQYLHGVSADGSLDWRAEPPQELPVTTDIADIDDDERAAIELLRSRGYTVAR